MAPEGWPRGPNATLRNSDAETARRICELAGVSYRELGRRTGLSHTHVRRILVGRSPVTELAAQAIAEALGLPVAAVFPLREATDAGQ